MKIGIASDSRGIELKQNLINYLKELDYNVIDFGTYKDEAVDYPDYAFAVGESIQKSEIDRGILICRTGIGMCMACNKVKGIRCGKVTSLEESYLARNDDNINVIALGCNLDITEASEIVKTFLDTPFSTEERHIRRVSKIDNYVS